MPSFIQSGERSTGFYIFGWWQSQGKTSGEGGMGRMLNYTIQGLLYAMIVAKGQLVTLLRPRKHSLHPAGRVIILRLGKCWILIQWRYIVDLHLLFNMLTGSTTFDLAESWTPLCLPKFNSKGFLHAYICYIAPDVSIVMISTDKDRFFDMSEWKSTLVEVRTEVLLKGK